MNASTIATAIAALEAYYSATVWKSQNWQADAAEKESYRAKRTSISAAIAELEALQADSAAVPQPVSEWTPVEHELYEYPDGKRGLVYANADGMGRPQLRYFRDADTDMPTETVIILPEHLRFCKRVVAASQPVAMPDDVRYMITEMIDDIKAHYQSPSEQWSRAMVIEDWLLKQDSITGDDK